jgi:hypothetical protein
MSPSSLPLIVYRGDTYRWQFILWSDADKTVPVDLTNVVVEAEVRDRAGGTLLIRFDIVVELPNIINMNLNAANSAALPGTGGVWDLQLTFIDGDVQTLLAGPLSVTMDVTNSASSVKYASGSAAAAAATVFARTKSMISAA